LSEKQRPLFYDYLPKRFLEQPMAEALSKGHVVDLDKLLGDYYTQRGWDEQGNITPEKLEELGLTDLQFTLE
jgi:aldehyde:ferredoxin oxidoreductase